MNSNKKIIVALVIALCPFASVFSQEIETEVISVEKDYKPSIENVGRERLVPEPEPEQQKKHLEYRTLTPDPRFSFIPKEISALSASIVSTKEQKLQNYADVAFGTQLSGFAEAFYLWKDNEDSFIVNFNFNNLLKKIDGWDKKALFLRSVADLTYAHRFSNYTASVSLGGGYNIDTYTGLPTSIAAVETIARKNSIDLAVKAELVSDYKYNILDNVTLAYDYYNNNFDVNEHVVGVEASVKVPFHGFSFSFDGKFDYLNSTRPELYSDSKIKEDGMYMDLLPAISYKAKNIAISLGVDVSMFASFDDYNYWCVSPELKVDYAIVPGILNVYFNYGGGIKPLSIGELNNINPYLSPIQGFTSNKTTSEFSVGLRGFISNKFYYDVAFAYEHLSQATVFGVDQNPSVSKSMYVRQNSFYAFSEKQDITSIEAQLTYEPIKNINLNIWGEYNFSWGSEMGKALYVPDYSLGFTFNGRFLNDKLLTTAKFAFIDGSSVYANGNYFKTKAYVDYYARIGYKVLPYMSVFVRADNSIAGKVYNYPLHPQFGFKIVGGISFEF